MAVLGEEKASMTNRACGSEDMHSFLFDLKEIKHTVEVSAGSV